MKHFHEKLVGLMLLLVLFVPLYSWMVQVVNASPPGNLVKSFSLESASEGVVSNVFEAGDTLVLIVESDLADTYELTIYQNSSVVLVESGRFEAGRGVVNVRLYSPSFRGGDTYSVVCRVLALNDPIPGAYFSDAVSSVFTVMKAETELVFSADYDSSVGSLYLSAGLAGVNGSYPVVNETIVFSWQRANTKRLTEGWLRLGSSNTDVNGVANLSLAFGLPNGNYLVRAYHKSNENFGESKNITSLEAFFNMSVIENLSLGLSSYSRFRVSSPPSPDPNLTIDVSNSTPYALLQMNATARYTIDVRYDRGIRLVFFRDFINETGFLNASTVAIPGSNPPYVYEGPLSWEPSVIGSHKLIAVVTGPEIANLTRVIHQGTDIIAFNEAQLDVQRCPSNVIVDFPEALYGDRLPVSVAVSKPRSYQPVSDGFYNVTTLAPELSYNGMEFVIDEGVNSTLVNLFVNGTEFSNQTDGSGVAYFSLGLNPSNVHSTLNLTAVVDGSSILNETVFGQVVPFTKVNVTDVPGAVSGDFTFGYTVNGVSGGGTLFDQVEDPLNIEASLLNRSLWNAPVSVIGAKHISNLKVLNNSRAGWDVPVLSDYLRVYKYFYNTSVAADVDNDNAVGIKDMAIVAKAYGSYPGMPNWNMDADIDGDNKVDIKDLALVAKYFGVSDVSMYKYPPQGVYLIFQPGDQMVPVDTQGATHIPPGAKNFTVWWTGRKVGAFINFTEITLDETFRTNNFGEVPTVWAPDGAGKYLLQVKLPSSLVTTVASYSDVSSIAASLNLVDWYDVVKRPLNLSVTHEPGEVTLDTPVIMIANVYDMAMKGPANGWPVRFYIKNGGGDWVYIWTVFTNSSGIATLTWLPSDYSSYPSWNFTLKAHIWETDHTQLTEKLISVDARFPTHVDFISQSGEVITGGVIKVPAQGAYEFAMKLTNASDGSPLSNREVYWYHNGSAHYTSYAHTNSSGIGESMFSGSASLKAVFEQNEARLKRSNEAKLFVVTEVVPTVVYFDVQPRDFKPGQQIVLVATVRNAVDTSRLLPNFFVSFYGFDINGVKERIEGPVLTNSTGVAVKPYTYPVSGVYAFSAEVTGQIATSSGLMLTVSQPTTLGVAVGGARGGGVSNDVFGYLKEESGGGIEGKTVRILIDNKDMQHVRTDSNGRFSYPFHFEPGKYNIQAVFDGDNPGNASAYSTMQNGTNYVVGATLQYGNKSAVDTTSLTVEMRSTTVIKPTKTPEQAQQEAEGSGAIEQWETFDTWYPWYRHHIRMSMNSAIIHLGFNPALPGGEIVEYSNLDQATSSLSPEENAEVFKEALLEASLGLLAAAAAVVATANFRILPATAIALGLYTIGLGTFMGIGYYLYSSGQKTEARGYMLGLFVDLWGIAILSLLPIRASVIGGMVFAVMSSLSSQILDPTSLNAALWGALAVMYAALGVGMAALTYVPEPSSITFKSLFPLTNIISAVISWMLLVGMLVS